MTSVVLVLASIGVIQALVLSLYLLTLKTNHRHSYILLAMILLGLSTRIGKSVFNYFLDLDPWMRNVGLAGFLVVGPSYFLYVRALVDSFEPNKKHLTLHFFLPIAYLSFCWLIPNEKSLTSYLSYSLVLFHTFAYLVSAEVYRWGASRRQYLAPELDVWLKWISSGLALVWLFYFLVFAGILPFYIGGAILYSVLIYGFSYLILNKSRFILDRYTHANPSRKFLRELLDRALKLAEDEKVFLDSQIKLESFAERLSESARNVSKAINEYHAQSFPEFINHFRISFAKNLLVQDSPRPMKIAAVALESGFGNIASFNAAFRAEVGMTPSEFRKSQKRYDDK